MWLSSVPYHINIYTYKENVNNMFKKLKETVVPGRDEELQKLLKKQRNIL